MEKKIARAESFGSEGERSCMWICSDRSASPHQCTGWLSTNVLHCPPSFAMWLVSHCLVPRCFHHVTNWLYYSVQIFSVTANLNSSLMDWGTKQFSSLFCLICGTLNLVFGSNSWYSWDKYKSHYIWFSYSVNDTYPLSRSQININALYDVFYFAPAFCSIAADSSSLYSTRHKRLRELSILLLCHTSIHSLAVSTVTNAEQKKRVTLFPLFIHHLLHRTSRQSLRLSVCMCVQVVSTGINYECVCIQAVR